MQILNSFRNKIKWDGKTVQLLELLVDVSVVIGVYILSVIIISEYSIYDLFNGGILSRDIAITSAFLAVGVILFFRVYKISITKRGYISTMFRAAISLTVITLLVLLLSVFNYTYSLPKTSLVLMLSIELLLLAFLKWVAYVILKKINIKTCLIIGPKEDVDSLAIKILFDDNKYILLKYLIYDDFNNHNISELFEYINSVDYVYLTEELTSNKKNVIISYCFRTKKQFYLVPKIYELSINKANVAQAKDTLLYEIKSLELSLEQRFIKRIFDLLTSFVGLIIAFPLMLIISIAIKLYDKGPILFRQERITRSNKKFMLYKFRSMIPNAEENTGPVQASHNDPRITPLGNFLRKTRLDELPQLINVLKGEMSIVGPRALRVEEVEEFINQDHQFSYRSNVKAGITGYAQTMGSYLTLFKDKLKFDIFYITNYSFLNDIIILLHTLRSVLDPSSSRGLTETRNLTECLESEGYHILSIKENYVNIVIKK